MEEKLIELEIRAEITHGNREDIKRKLEKRGILHSQTKRLSVMCFGSVGTKKIDVRVRVTNGECEVVVKSGSFGSHDRVEVAQNIEHAQFLGMVKIFSQFGFTMEVGERKTLNYTLLDDTTISLVSAGPIAYVELEKMSTRSNVDQNNKRLRELADQLELKLLGSEEEFDTLCKRLTESVDWPFHGTNEEYVKLIELLNHYTNRRPIKKADKP
ncbi:MAG: hypothetical protein AAB653_00945 [Patescibacteria group bacterium]